MAKYMFLGSYASLCVCLSVCHWTKIHWTIIHISITIAPRVTEPINNIPFIRLMILAGGLTSTSSCFIDLYIAHQVRSRFKSNDMGKKLMRKAVILISYCNVSKTCFFPIDLWR